MGKWLGKLATRWRKNGEAKRDLLAFALLLGYNPSFGALQICDQLAGRAFWKPSGNGIIHDLPMPPVLPGYLLPLHVGEQRKLAMPGLENVSLTHTAQELMVKGELRLSETVTIRGLYEDDFVYRRSYPQAGGVEIEARLGNTFRALSLPVHTLSADYISALRQLAGRQGASVPHDSIRNTPVAA